MLVGDLDNDGEAEVVYYLYEGAPAANGTLIVYKNIGNNQYIVVWDTLMSYGGYPFAITDIDNDGRKEIVVHYNSGENCSAIGLLECFGPGQFRFYSTNICGPRGAVKVLETDVNDDGVKELSVLFSDTWPQYDRTFVDIAQYTGKYPCGSGCTGWFMSFSPQRLARYNWYITDFAVGQVDGEGWDEIILGDGGFLSGGGQPEYITYLKYTPPDGPFSWRPHYFSVGLPVLCTAPMFINLDGDRAKEMFIGGVGPHGRGSAYAIKYTSDSTWQTMWIDSTFQSSPLWVNDGTFYENRIVAGANWFEIQNETYSGIRLYSLTGQGLGTWRRDSAVIWMFHLLDIDRDSSPNLVFAQGSLVYGHRAVDFEIAPTLAIQTMLPTPSRAFLYQNSPNPFNPSTTIMIDLEQPTAIQLTVFDVLGRRVTSLANEMKDAGLHMYVWQGTDDNTAPLSSGIYLYELRTDHSLFRKKMILLR